MARLVNDKKTSRLVNQAISKENKTGLYFKAGVTGFAIGALLVFVVLLLSYLAHRIF